MCAAWFTDPAVVPMIGVAVASFPWHARQLRAFGALHAWFHVSAALTGALNGAAVFTPSEWQYVLAHVIAVALYAPPDWLIDAATAVVEKFTVWFPRTWFVGFAIVVRVLFATTCAWHSSHP